MAKRVKLKRRQILVRVCNRDGIRWHVPAELRVPPLALEVTGARWAASGERWGGGFGRGHNVHRMRLEESKRQAEALQFCPNCGQRDYHEVASDRMPLAVEAQQAELRARHEAQAMAAAEQALRIQQQALAEAAHRAQWDEYYRQKAAWEMHEAWRANPSPPPPIGVS